MLSDRDEGKRSGLSAVDFTEDNKRIIRGQLLVMPGISSVYYKCQMLGQILRETAMKMAFKIREHLVDAAVIRHIVSAVFGFPQIILAAGKCNVDLHRLSSQDTAGG